MFEADPSQRRRKDRRPRAGSEWIEVRVPFRPPLHVGHLFPWLDIHAIDGVEEVDWGGGAPVYRRSLRLPGGAGVVEVRPTENSMLTKFRLDSIADLQVAIQRMRRLLDLDSDPAVIDRALAVDPALAPLVGHRPGLRLPGEVDGIDAAIRAVIHQQVSVASARSVCSRLVAAHGEPLANPIGAVTRLFPDAGTWASLDPASLGMPSARAATVVRIAAAIDDGEVDLTPSADRADAVRRLQSVKGIGPWTAAVVATKALGDPDVFASGDLALRRAAEAIGLPSDPRQLDDAAHRWRPWRTYAMHHLWAEYLSATHPTVDQPFEDLS